MEQAFPADYQAILEQINRIDPVLYGKNRNHIDGAVTYLSPYISRGVISTRQVLQSVVQRGYKLPQIESFVKELCWRDYFQRVAQHKNVSEEIRHPQQPVSNREIPAAIVNATTGIQGIDSAIAELYQTGYMHNHCRMYTAALACNIAQSHWHNPAQWMYYHLLDGDWASNACSWQWVAGANSSKKYVANQENINKYTHTAQANTFLDLPYEAMNNMPVPHALAATQPFCAQTALPQTTAVVADAALPTFIYNYYNLDPLWHKGEPGNRILLLEPEFFRQYPISNKCMDFMLALGNNIPGLQFFVGSFQSLVQAHKLHTIYYKEHPLNTGYQGTEDPRHWITDKVSGYFPSFFAYWKRVERQLFP